MLTPSPPVNINPNYSKDVNKKVPKERPGFKVIIEKMAWRAEEKYRIPGQICAIKGNL